MSRPTTASRRPACWPKGTLNQPQWVYAEVDLARLQRVKETGEMRNSTDWAAQPGAAPLASKVEVVALG